MGLAEEKQQLEMLLRQVKSIQSLSAILPTYAQGITITLLILVVDIMLWKSAQMLLYSVQCIKLAQRRTNLLTYAQGIDILELCV